MIRFLRRYIVLVWAMVLAMLSIFAYDMLSLISRDYPGIVHSIYFVIASVILFGIFYAGISYFKTLREDDDQR